MPDQPKKPRPGPRGRALDSDDSELDAAAEIQPEDIERAKEAARRHGRDTEIPELLESEEP